MVSVVTLCIVGVLGRDSEELMEAFITSAILLVVLRHLSVSPPPPFFVFSLSFPHLHYVSNVVSDGA